MQDSGTKPITDMNGHVIDYEANSLDYDQFSLTIDAVSYSAIDIMNRINLNISVSYLDLSHQKCSQSFLLLGFLLLILLGFLIMNLVSL